ncbi:hypothetical protein [Brucella sp. 2280]|uniref:hypothetical protein n=1 Tax=Brucella sp. 2280 TaxID=2592625 RepID=UPI001AEE47BA|nr:hypothetical protein [Brucella sp. 2280]
MSKLDLWEAHADIDPAMTKAITGKAYKGTSPNPQHVIWCLTDMFGPVGQGFGWEVLAEDFTPLGEEILHWCRIRFWHTDRQNYYEAYGQTKALMKTRNSGLMSDEDAPKKSLTDAIIKAASQLGIAANIFLGRWDDQKYVDELKKEFRQDEPANSTKLSTKSEDARVLYAALEKDMRRIKARADLVAWWKDSECVEKRKQLPEDWQKNLHDEFVRHGKSLPDDQREAA